jgi:formate hydrogenlyase transcriptional activator
MKKVMETIPSAAMDALCQYHWPGNIRELQNVIERAVIISAGPVLSIDVSALKSPKAMHVEQRAATPQSPTNGALHGVLEETERRHILGALQQCNWVVAGPHGAAALLGINRSTLQIRIRKLGISRATA